MDWNESGEKMKNFSVDFVLPWVDGSDKKWLDEKNRYSIPRGDDGSIARYRDYGLLRYWFRGIEEFAPWVHKIFFVTYGHVPSWLDLDNPKLVVVKHSDYIPEKYLPTFSSHCIENNLFRIKGLSERFVLFNDDVFLLKKCSVSDFFDKEGMPMDTIGLNVHCVKKSMLGQFFAVNDVGVINEHFEFKKTLRENKLKWMSPLNGKVLVQTIVLSKCPRFPGFWQHHLSGSFLKSTFEEVWKKETDLLDASCKHRFRERTDVNEWLFKEWQIASGNFKIRSYKFGKSFFVDRDGLSRMLGPACSYIKNQKGKEISINDGDMDDSEFSLFKKMLAESFEEILPYKSKFEK